MSTSASLKRAAPVQIGLDRSLPPRLAITAAPAAAHEGKVLPEKRLHPGVLQADAVDHPAGGLAHPLLPRCRTVAPHGRAPWSRCPPAGPRRRRGRTPARSQRSPRRRSPGFSSSTPRRGRFADRYRITSSARNTGPSLQTHFAPWAVVHGCSPGRRPPRRPCAAPGRAWQRTFRRPGRLSAQFFHHHLRPAGHAPMSKSARVKQVGDKPLLPLAAAVGRHTPSRCTRALQALQRVALVAEAAAEGPPRSRDRDS